MISSITLIMLTCLRAAPMPYSRTTRPSYWLLASPGRRFRNSLTATSLRLDRDLQSLTKPVAPVPTVSSRQSYISAFWALGGWEEERHGGEPRRTRGTSGSDVFAVTDK